MFDWIQILAISICSGSKRFVRMKTHSENCKTLNICGIKFLRLKINDVLANFNFGIHGIHVRWLQTVKKI